MIGPGGLVRCRVQSAPLRSWLATSGFTGALGCAGSDLFCLRFFKTVQLLFLSRQFGLQLSLLIKQVLDHG